MLKDQMQGMRISITKAVSDETLNINHAIDPSSQERWFRDIKAKFEKLEPTDEIDSAQAATETSHKDWRDIKSVGVQKGLSSLLSSGQAQKEKLELKAREAFQKYYEQGEARKDVHEINLMETCQI